MEYSFGSLRNAESSPRNFLVLVLWNFGISEEYSVVHGAEHVGFEYRRLLARSISSPLIGTRNKLIKTSIYHLLHTVCCSATRALRLGAGSTLFLHYNRFISTSDARTHFVRSSNPNEPIPKRSQLFLREVPGTDR